MKKLTVYPLDLLLVLILAAGLVVSLLIMGGFL